MKKSTLIVVLTVTVMSTLAWAVSHPFSGTINTPAVPTWVDGSGNEIAPYLTLGPSNALYLDTGTGYIWTIQDLMTNPTAIGQALAGVHYTNNNCTGTAHLIIPTFSLPKLVQTAPVAGTFYVGGAAAPTATLQSYSVGGNCYVGTFGTTSEIYLATGPLTPPSLTSAPWHLENR